MTTVPEARTRGRHKASAGGRWPVRLNSLLPAGLRRWPVILLILVAAAFTAACLREAWLDSPTVDEPVYVASGVLIAVHQDLSFNQEHQPLPKAIAALPVLAARPAIPAGWSHVRGKQEGSYAARFTKAQLAAGKLRMVTFLSRLVPILEALATGLVLYRLGALLFGPSAGAVAGVLWLASPVSMGLGHIDGVDLPIALAAALTSLALLRWYRRRDRVSLVLTGLAAGLAAAAGLSGLLAVASAGAVVAGVTWRGRGGLRALGSGAAVALAAFAVLWASYAMFDPLLLLHPAGFLPQPYAGGLRFLQLHDSKNNGWAYLWGVQWQGRRWWYWPGSVLVKTPAPTLLLLIAGPLALLAVPRAARREALLTVGLPAAALTIFTIFVPPDTGIRYLLPAIALLLVLASAVVFLARRYASRAVLAVLVTISIALGASSFPHSIAWTQPPFTPGYRYASGSNLDWGQDYSPLLQWSRGRHAYVAFHAGHGLGTIPGTRSLTAASPRSIVGWVAVSATLLTARGNAAPAWLRHYCPVTTIAGTILVYRFARPPAATTPGPPFPAGLCRDSRYSRLSAAGSRG